jgi:hypothetical protein
MKQRIRIPNLSDRTQAQRRQWRQAGLRRDDKGVVMSEWRREQLERLRRRQISWESYFRCECPTLWRRQ